MSLDADKIRLIMHLRRVGITDQAVLGAIERIPREAFVPPSFRDRAYDDTALPLSHGQTISQPQIVAMMTAALNVGDRDKVLEIGTGSGYQTAILSQFCRRVYTVEREAELQKTAMTRLAELRIRNVSARVADGTAGWPEVAPFERILVAAAWDADRPPPALLEQLAEDGVMVIPLTLGAAADYREQWLCRITKSGGEIASKPLSPVRFVPLIADSDDGAERAKTG